MPLNWLPPTPINPNPAVLAALAHLPPETQQLAAEILLRRGHDDPTTLAGWLDPDHYTPAPPTDLPDLSIAAEKLVETIKKGDPILVWGDFDVDGQTATSLLVDSITELGGQVRWHIPHRQKESHGIRPEFLARELETPTALMLTCDTGITSYEALDLTREQGLPVIVTDHHQLGKTLPDVLAVVNPQRLPPQHPAHTLPGVGVAYLLMHQVYALMGQPNGIVRHQDLMALGIVADVATQTGDTRYYLQRGLAQLRRTPRIGLQALYKAAELADPSQLDETHIGFSLAPRLNAIGRLGDANPMVDLLTTDDPVIARALVGELESLNTRRRLLTDQIYRAALALLDQNPNLAETPVLVLMGQDWPGGVIGLVAGRLANQFQKPVLLLSEREDGHAGGSARSIDGVNITAALAENAALLTNFGGHPMAAGVALPARNVESLRRGLNVSVARQLAELTHPPATLTLDADLPLAAATLETADALIALSPFGAGNPAPLFRAQNLTLVEQTSMGRNSEHRKLTVADADGQHHTVFWWQGGNQPLPTSTFDLAYTLQSSTWKGERNVQRVWIDIQASTGQPLTLTPVVSRITFVDRRQHQDPQIELHHALTANPTAQVWREATVGVAGQTRQQLQPAETLIIYTAPPAPAALLAVVQAVNPQTIVLICSLPTDEHPRGLLTVLASLAKYAIRTYGGQADLARMAAASGLTEDAVRAGLLCLQAQGLFTIAFEGDQAQITLGTGNPTPARAEIEAEFRLIVREVAAYRRFSQTAASERLFAGLQA